MRFSFSRYCPQGWQGRALTRLRSDYCTLLPSAVHRILCTTDLYPSPPPFLVKSSAQLSVQLPSSLEIAQASGTEGNMAAH